MLSIVNPQTDPILQQRQASLPPYYNAPRWITESLERLVQRYGPFGNKLLIEPVRCRFYKA